MELPTGKATIFTVAAFIIGGLIMPMFTGIKDYVNMEKQNSYKEAEINSKHLEYLNDITESGLQKQLELAKYFSCVSTDEETRQGWLRYYNLKKNEINESRQIKKQKEIEIENILFDSNYDNCFSQCFPMYYSPKKNKRTNISDYERYRLKKLEVEVEEITINQSQKVSDNKINKNTILKKVYIQYNNEKDQIDIDELNQRNWIIPPAEKIKYEIGRNEIRYFNDSDVEFAQELKDIIDTDTRKFKLRKVNLTAPLGQLEIWIKKI